MCAARRALEGRKSLSSLSISNEPFIPESFRAESESNKGQYVNLGLNSFGASGALGSKRLSGWLLDHILVELPVSPFPSRRLSSSPFPRFDIH